MHASWQGREAQQGYMGVGRLAGPEVDRCPACGVLTHPVALQGASWQVLHSPEVEGIAQVPAKVHLKGLRGGVGVGWGWGGVGWGGVGGVRRKFGQAGGVASLKLAAL